MKLTIKNLKGEFFEVEVEEEETLAGLKDKIKQKSGQQSDDIKLIHKGKQLVNLDSSLAKEGIKEGDFVIFIPVKNVVKKEDPKKEQSAPPAPSPLVQPPVPSPPVQPPAPAPSSTGFLSQAEYDSTIKFLEDMGFTKEQCVAALRAAYFNADRAVEYLFNGIPATSAPPPPVMPPSAPGVVPAPPSAGSAPTRTFNS